jgi:hypothetical protein
LISFITYQPKQRKGAVDFSRIIPESAFEWIAGLRKYGIMISFLYLAALGLCFVQFASLFIAWFITMIIAEFYEECESIQILIVDELPANDFIIKKMRSQTLIYLQCIMPLLVIYSIFNYATFYITIGFLFFSILNINCSILSKYALYTPNSILSENKIINGLIHASILIPFLLPLSVIMFFRNYWRANEKLNKYLNAYY